MNFSAAMFYENYLTSDFNFKPVCQGPFTCQFWCRQWDFRVLVEISQVYWRYKTINFSLHYSTNISRITIVSQIFYILFFFCQLMRLFRKDLQRNVLHSIQMPCFIYKGIRTHVYFILGNNNRAWHGLTVTNDTIMEGGGVHSKFMHILVHEFVSSRKSIVSYLVFFYVISFLGRIKGSQFTEPMSARIRNCIECCHRWPILS